MSDETIDTPEVQETEVQTVEVQDPQLITKPDPQKLQDLFDAENRIENRTANTLYHNGMELAQILEQEQYKLHRPDPIGDKYEFESFDEYCKARFGYGDTYGYRTIQAAKVLDGMLKLSPKQIQSPSWRQESLGDNLPKKEAHIRPLLTLDTPEDQLSVWETVIEEHTSPSMTLIDTAVKRFQRNKNRDYQTIEEWKAAPWPISYDGTGTFNKQDGNDIEWARFSYNPITGCEHECSYCYARNMQNRLMPEKKFAPARHPGRYAMPKNTKVPQEADIDLSYKNVFVGSMADMFGRWVPAEWIEEVIQCAEDNQQWHYLFLTKFPNRYQEFTYPKNVWLGTSVDCQARVKNAEKAFENVEGTTWLSVEPMLEHLQFEHLERFNWVVIGGASPRGSSPEWIPNMDWIMDLYQQARKANCAIYFKDNLPITGELRLKEFPWHRPPLRKLPEVFKYMASIK